MSTMIAPIERTFAACYYDGETPRRYAAEAELTPVALRIRLPEIEREMVWTFAALRLACNGQFGEPVVIEHTSGPVGESLSVAADTFADALRQNAPDVWDRSRDQMELRGWPATMMSMAAIVVLGVALYGAVTGWLAEGLVALMPRSMEDRLGRGVTNMLATEPMRCKDPQGEALLNRVTLRLSDAAKSTYWFRVIYSKDKMVNAFAAPGGRIVVFRGLLEMAETPEELAGVLGHEMQHVMHRDSTRALARYFGVRALMSLMAADSTGTPMAFQGAAGLANLSFQREAEERADSDAVELLIKAKVDPRGLPNFFRRLQGGNATTPGAMQYLSTHPDLGARVTRLTQLIESQQLESAPLLTATEWKQAKAACAY